MRERIVDTPEWQALNEHAATMAYVHLRELFAADAQRGANLTVTAGDLYVDYSKHNPVLQTLSGPAILLVWLYVMANVIVLGAEVNWWRAGRALPSDEALTTSELPLSRL